MSRLSASALAAAALVLACAATLPRAWLGRDAGHFLGAPDEHVLGLARAVAARGPSAPSELHTGSEHFDGEWALVTNQMTVLGLGQLVRQDPALAPELVPPMRAAAAAMLREEALAFGEARWGEPPLGALDGDHGHAYLGYAALALNMLRAVDPAPDPALSAAAEGITAALARRLAAAPRGMIETYPGVTFPADVAACVGAVGLEARFSGQPPPPLVRAWGQTLRERYLGEDGLVAQTVDPERGVPTSAARASGTAILVYFVSFADLDLALELDRAQAARLRTFWGFGGMREYPAGTRGARGDIDSGPVLFGVSVSGSGFGLAGARMSGDHGRFTALFRTATLFGAPVRRGEGWGYAVGSGLGDAILLAMMTAEGR